MLGTDSWKRYANILEFKPWPDTPFPVPDTCSTPQITLERDLLFPEPWKKSNFVVHCNLQTVQTCQRGEILLRQRAANFGVGARGFRRRKEPLCQSVAFLPILHYSAECKRFTQCSYELEVNCDIPFVISVIKYPNVKKMVYRNDLQVVSPGSHPKSRSRCPVTFDEQYPLTPTHDGHLLSTIYIASRL